MDESVCRAIVDHLQDGVYFVDPARKILSWNRSAERISGYPAAAVVGRSCSDNVLVHVDDAGMALCSSGCPLSATMVDGRAREAKVYLHHRDGHRKPVFVRTIAVHDSSGKVIGGVELFSDSDESVAIRQKLDELGRLALLDPLTGIANRRCLSMNLESRLDEHARYGWPFALLFADVDRFKRVNDLFGHATGDRVLKMVANAIQCGLRSFDLAGRWGGEEFVVLLAGTPPEAVRPSAERLRMLIEQSGLPANGADIRVTVTIGAVAATSGATADSMIDEADRLMYLGKKAGRNRVVVGGTAVVAD